MDDDNEPVQEQGADQEQEGFEDQDALLSRLRVIEEQPLDQRASAFVQLHDELRSSLEGSDSSGLRG